MFTCEQTIAEFRAARQKRLVTGGVTPLVTLSIPTPSIPTPVSVETDPEPAPAAERPPPDEEVH